MKNRSWIFVYNNYTTEREASLYEILKKKSKYFCYGHEVGEEGTPHLQGYVTFREAEPLSALKKIDKKVHWQVAKGTAEENYFYSSKQDKEGFVQWGVPSRQGQRNDILRVREILKKTPSMRTVMNECTSYQSARFAELYLKYNEPPRTDKPQVYWYWGPTGTGKTRRAVEQSGDDYWISGDDGKWFDGYDGQKNIILHDFSSGWISFENLLRLLDRYPIRVQNKGGSRQLLCSQIIITCDRRPEEVYPLSEQDKGQLLRRIDKIKHFKKSKN